jgi:hypothetical protein
MNIYGNLMVVDRKNKATGLLAFFSSDEQRCDTSMFSPGDRVIFRDPATLLPLEENTVVKTDWAENERFMITMEKEIRGEVTGSFLENLTKIPDLVEIQGNYLGRVPTRSILMYASMKSIIEKNIFHRSQMPAILIKTPDPPYHLQGVVQDLTIRNNVFFECGDLAECAVIAIDPQVSAADYKKPVYQQVKIVDNLFITREIMVPLLKAGSTHGLMFSGNRVESGETDETLLSFTACAGVVIKNNLIFNRSRPFRIEFIHSTHAELRLDPAQDWIINKVSQ